MHTHIDIQVVNWSKYQPRKDVAKHSWFRVNNEIITAPGIFGLTAEQKWIWICLLCIVSKKSHEQYGAARINIEWLVKQTGVKKQVIIGALKCFQESEMISIGCEERDVGVTSAYADERIRALHYITLQNTILPISPKLDFDAIYKIYPLKRGKSAGMTWCKKNISTEKDLQDLEKATLKYAEQCKIEKVEKRFIKHWSTFVRQYKDILDEDAGSCTSYNGNSDYHDSMIKEMREAAEGKYDG